MKKLLLTLIAGFCFSGLVMAQDGTKISKKKATPALSTATAEYAARLQAKEAKVKAFEAGKNVQATTTQNARASAAADKAVDAAKN